jgi:predicted DCC family thiol-disulfide oxidoreductase YuxK
MTKLFVLYDPECGLCDVVRGWMLDQRSSMQIEVLARESPRALTLFPDIHPQPDELVVVDDEGSVYRGDSAFIICIYALDAYRAWAYRLSSPILRPFARRAFEMLSKNRKKISDLLALANDEVIAHELSRTTPEVAVW